MVKRVMFLLGILAMGLGLNSSATAAPEPELNVKDWVKLTNGEHYQQTQLLRFDPKADAFLIRKLDQMPWKLVNTLIKNDYPQNEVEKAKELDALESQQNAEALSSVSGSSFPGKTPESDNFKASAVKPHFTIGKTPSINVERLCNKIHEIILQHPDITPVITIEHDWSPDAQHYMLYGFWQRFAAFLTGHQKEFPSPLFFRSKLFLLLGCGWTSRYAFTGYEAPLVKFIMSQPDRSVQMHDVFREAYLLTRGDVYLTLLTAENVLAGNPYREDRQNDPLQKKLLYIRNDSAPYGDNYGAWYHFYGIGLYGLVRPSFIARAVGEIESLGSIFLEGFDRQEDYINRLGAIFGRKLNRLIEKGAWKKPLTKDDRTDYMTIVPVPEKP
ncbi:MAG: hypothetical protein WA705_04875 [Candidatus Ozemobacteraceae bacterium]